MHIATKHGSKAKSNGHDLDAEIRSNILKVIRIEREQLKKRTFGERLSDLIALFCGRMVFVYVHLVWFAAWIIYNSLLPNVKPFDPYPYTFLTMVVSLEAIFLSTFILISQNHDTQMSERRNQLDLQINMLAEKENTRVLQLLTAIAEKVGIAADDAVMNALSEETDPASLAEQIISVSDEKSASSTK